MKVVIAFDSFKGSLSSLELAASAREGIFRVCPDAEVSAVAIADGGEGTLEALAADEGARKMRVRVNGPLGEPAAAAYALLPGDIAVVELAQSSGLPMVPPQRRDPETTTTFGMGEVILDALDKGARRFLIGLGGSATNDGGMGFLTALGWKFLDEKGAVLPGVGASLARVRDIDSSGADARLRQCAFDVACDVDNPLCGPRGAARVYGPQKGATSAQVEALDGGLRNFAACVQRAFGIDVLDVPGAGAAGGCGAACLAFLKARLRPGIECVLDAVGFDALLQGADLVLTGEGRLDAQSLMGKAPQGIARRAKSRGVPVVALAGSVQVDGAALREAGIVSAFSIQTGPVSLEDAMRPENARRSMAAACESVISLFAR